MRRFSLMLAILLALGSWPVTTASADGVNDVPPTVVAYAPNRLIIYENTYPTSGNYFNQKSWNGTSWTGWSVANPGAAAAPAAANGNIAPIWDGRLGLFWWTQLADGNMWCSPGSRWTFISGAYWSVSRQNATPALLNVGFSTATVIGVDNQGRVLNGTWQISTDGQNGCGNTVLAFNNTGGSTNWTPGLAGTSPTDYLVAVAGTDANHTVWWSYNNGPWNATTGQSQGAVSATTWGSGRYDLFVRGTDGALWHNWDNNTTWEPLGGGLYSGPQCASWAPGRIDCFSIGTDLHHHVFHIFYSCPAYPNCGGVTWSAWEDLGTA